MNQSSQSASGVVSEVQEYGTIAIMRLRQHGLAVEIGRELVGAGLPVLEVTFDHPDAPRALASMVEQLPANAVVGAGTVRRPEQVLECKAAGGRFCVSPHTDPELIRACVDNGLEPIPGACTATEVAAAVDAGARLVKLFPAGPLGVGYLRAMLGPFREVHFVPTGGIRHHEVGPWLVAGAAAVGLGSDLVPGSPKESDAESVAARARVVAQEVAKARSSLGQG